MKRVVLAASIALVSLAAATSVRAQEIFSAYSSFDADKNCKHTPGREVEDYGSWICPGHGSLIVRLTAGDQRMQVSFGRSARAAASEVAASQTFPGFNSVYRGNVEWRIEKLPNGKTWPFAAILRWNTRTAVSVPRRSSRPAPTVASRRAR